METRFPVSKDTSHVHLLFTWYALRRRTFSFLSCMLETAPVSGGLSDN